MTLSSQDIGTRGEQIATDYLLARGYCVLERNYRVGRLEIDIVAQRSGSLYFVEVKTRSCTPDSAQEFMPEAAMTPLKKQKILRAAEQYISQTEHQGESYIDLIAVNIAPQTHHLRHYSAL